MKSIERRGRRLGGKGLLYGGSLLLLLLLPVLCLNSPANSLIAGRMKLEKNQKNIHLRVGARVDGSC